MTAALAYLEEHDKAAKAFQDLMVVEPAMSNSFLDQHHPGDAKHIEFVCEGLRKAGLPEG